MMNIKKKATRIKAKTSTSDWKGYEHAYGYGMMVMPFSSGHLLGFRVFPQNDFAPYKSLWHCDPDGRWSIFNDGPSLKTTCPRWWGPALKHKSVDPFSLQWTGEKQILIEMASTQIRWQMELSTTPLLNVLNTINAAMPRWKWMYPFMKKMHQEVAKKRLGMGSINFSFQTPSGMSACILPEEIYGAKDAKATYKGNDLGEPTNLGENPTIGKVALPKRPAFMIGHAYARIKDINEYRATKAQFSLN